MAKNDLANLEKLWKNHEMSKRTKLHLTKCSYFQLPSMSQSHGPLMLPVLEANWRFRNDILSACTIFAKLI